MSQQAYQAIRRGAGVRPRATRAVVALTGADRADYLQGLLTNDIKALGDGEGCYSAYLTPQGRMVTDMEVLQMRDHILLDVERSVASSLASRLEEFVFTEDVTVSDWTDARVSYGVDGPLALATVASAFSALGVAADIVSDVQSLGEHGGRSVTLAREPLVVARTDELGVLGVVILVVPSEGARLHEALVSAGAVDVDPETAEVVRIESGRPVFPVDMDNETIPLEAGIETRAISMTKGCYVGQEVVVRILHRGEGRVAQRLVGLTMDHAAGDDVDSLVPPRGAALWHGEQSVGRITSATSSPSLRQVIALGYVPRALAEAGTRVEVDIGRARRGAVVTPIPFVTTGSFDAR